MGETGRDGVDRRVAIGRLSSLATIGAVGAVGVTGVTGVTLLPAGVAGPCRDQQRSLRCPLMSRHRFEGTSLIRSRIHSGLGLAELQRVEHRDVAPARAQCANECSRRLQPRDRHESRALLCGASPGR